MKPSEPARIHLIPAKMTDEVLVIRRKPSKLFHIMRWNTRKDQIEHGSWLQGKLYPKRCDISFDGKWMVYLAMGSDGRTWNGICRLPFLRTLADAPNMGSWNGGGYWSSQQILQLNQWQPTNSEIPFTLAALQPKFGGEDFSVLFPRWERDGWRRRGDNFGTSRRIEDAPEYTVVNDGDDGWANQPSQKHPALIARYIGYLKHGQTFRFSLEGHPDLLDEQVDSACWSRIGDLLFSRLGVLYRYTLDDLKRSRTTFVQDLEPLQRPAA